MGSRARKKWQGDLLSTLPTTHSDDDDDDSSEDEDDQVIPTTQKKAGFALMMADDESSSDDDEDESSSKEEEVEATGNEGKLKSDDAAETPKDRNDTKENEVAVLQEEEDDLDAILDEFQRQDLNRVDDNKASTTTTRPESEFAPILRNVDVRDLDIDRSLRNALHGGDAAGPPTNSNNRGGGSAGRAARTTHVFGAPPPNTPRPPHFVGGGLGMTSYDRLSQDTAPDIPWPYSQKSTNAGSTVMTYADPSRWYTFQYSDTYARELQDYRQIEQSGDVNALLLFVAHHPFCTDALFQLVSVLNQTNHAQEGQQLLKRALWVYECAALPSFHKDLLITSQHALVDGQRPENAKFLEALWELLVRQCVPTGLHKSAWTVGRYLWGLDPWRDPMGVLLVLDSLALSCQTDEADQWILDVVPDEYCSQIWYKETADETKEAQGPTHCGKLVDMPNWAFSYALALFRVHGNDEGTSNKALKKALRAFPGVVGMILQKLDVDTTGRSFRRDWVTILDKATKRSQTLHHVYLGQDDTITTTATIQAMEFIVKIWLESHTKSWGDDEVLQWLYDNLVAVLEEPIEAPPLSPALMRYTRFRPPHYETRVQQFPADANIIDPGLIAHAMVVDANRPRLLRRQQQRQQQEEAAGLFAAGQQHRQILGGPPTGIVDPDWPILEVFWRSMLPWNRVEGVPPPNR
uniref:Uncharacterized protein n=2 Tax=Amphora coffeiformis TaxID=265554 RepID=A0A7S3P3G0_9STRA